MTVGQRTRAARDVLRDYLRENPDASKDKAAKWLNNHRQNNQRLTLPFSEINRVFLEVRLEQQNKPAIFNPPRLVLPKPPEPPKAMPIEVIAPGMSEPDTKFFTPGHQDRKKFIEDLALENPTARRQWILEKCHEKFGIGISPNIAQEALETARVLAGMKAKLRIRRPVEAPPVSLEKPAMPLPDPPPPPLKPDAMLREAAGVLKLLVEKMGWERLAITIDHKGEITYDATPLPVLAAKGSLRL